MKTTCKGHNRTADSGWGRAVVLLFLTLIHVGPINTVVAQPPGAGSPQTERSEDPTSDAADETPSSGYRIAEIADYGRIFSSSVADDRPTGESDRSLLVEAENEPALLAELRIVRPSEVEWWGYLIDELSASTFAARERANVQLHQAGYQIVPLLRWRLSTETDSEAKLRIGQLMTTLDDQYAAAVTADFLAGNDAALEGWSVARELMGNSISSRRAYVAVYQQYPDLARSLAGTTADREAAVVAYVERPLVDRTRTGITALLMAAADPALQPSLRVESQVGSWYRQSGVSQLRRMADSMIYGERLLSAFLLKTSRGNREDWLYHGLNQELSATEQLAKRTLVDTTDPDTLCLAMAALMHHADRDNVDVLAAFFDDDRVLMGGGIGLRAGERVETRVSDVAMAAVGGLLGQTTKELGFPANANHPIVGLDMRQVVIPAQDPEIAAAIRGQIRTSVENLMGIRSEDRQRVVKPTQALENSSGSRNQSQEDIEQSMKERNHIRQLDEFGN